MKSLRSCFGCFGITQNDAPVVNPQLGRGDGQNLTPRVGNVRPETMRVISDAVRFCEQQRAEQRRIWEQAGGDRLGRTPLHHAAIASDLNQVRMLCNRGDNVNAADAFGMTPLYRAVLNNQASIVSELLANNADLVSPASDVTTLACIAARNGYEDVMRVLVNHNRESITHVSDRSGYSAVHEAAGGNQVGILKLFVELGINLEVKSQRMDWPLDTAREAKSWGAISYLKTPPKNNEAVQVIRGDRKLTLNDLNRWADSRNASGIEDLSLAIRAIFVAWMNGDINGADSEVQNRLANLFHITATKVSKMFNVSEGRKYQFCYIDAMKDLCRKKGLLSNNNDVNISETLELFIKTDDLTQETRADFRQCYEKIKFMGEVSQGRFENDAQAAQRNVNELFVGVAKRTANARYVSQLDTCLQAICQGAEVVGAMGMSSIGGVS